MSEPNEADAPDPAVEADEMRQHPQDPAEGPDEETSADDVPRVHSEDPAEG